MVSVNNNASHKFVVVLNGKSPLGKLLSATGQLAMSIYKQASPEQRLSMNLVPFTDPRETQLIHLSTASFVVLKAKQKQLLSLYSNILKENILSAVFTSTMSFNGVEEDLMHKTSSTIISDSDVYGVGLYGAIEVVNPLTKKFSVFK